MIAYLGDEADGSQRSFRKIFDTDVENLNVGVNAPLIRNSQEDMRKVNTNRLPPKGDAVWNSLFKFFARPWLFVPRSSRKLSRQRTYTLYVETGKSVASLSSLQWTVYAMTGF